MLRQVSKKEGRLCDIHAIYITKNVTVFMDCIYVLLRIIYIFFDVTPRRSKEARGKHQLSLLDVS